MDYPNQKWFDRVVNVYRMRQGFKKSTYIYLILYQAENVLTGFPYWNAPVSQLQMVKEGLCAESLLLKETGEGREGGLERGTKRPACHYQTCSRLHFKPGLASASKSWASKDSLASPHKINLGMSMHRVDSLKNMLRHPALALWWSLRGRTYHILASFGRSCVARLK